MGNAPSIMSIEKDYNEQDSNNDDFKSSNNKSRISMLDVFCGNRGAKDIVRNIEVNEIILSKTYSDPKGTYNNESIKFFNAKEKLLFYFASKDNVAAVRYFTINGVNINILDEDRTSPLHIACRSGSLQMVEELINQGAMINLPDLVGWTPLHIACYHLRPDVVLLLLKNGANYQTRNRDKQLPKELCEKNSECAEIFENFMLHKEIDMMRTIQQKEMQINYYTQCLENIENNHQNNNITNLLMEKEQYFNTIDYGILNSNRNRNVIEQDNEDIPKCINVDKSIGMYRHSSSSSNTNYNHHKKEMHKSNNIPHLNSHSNQHDYNNTFDHFNYQSNSNNNEEEEDTDEVPNEFVNYKQEPLNYKSNKERREYTKKLLANYKFIPKKHKFYLQYKMCNGKVLSRTISNSYDFHTSKDNSISNLIRLPNHFPVFNSIQHLNNNDNNNKNNRLDIEEEQEEEDDNFNLITEEHEKYRAYDNHDNDDYSSCSNDSTNNLYPSLMINHIKVDQMSNADKSNDKNNHNENKESKSNIIHEETETINNNTNSNHIDYEKLLFNDKETHKFLLENHSTLNNIFLNRFMLCKEEIEELLLSLFKHDYNFSLMLLMSLYPNKNTYGSLAHIIKRNIILKELKSTILTGGNLFEQLSISLLSIYFSFFNYNNLNEVLHETMSNIMVQKDICIIDRISYCFAKQFYHCIHNTEEGYLIQSENSLYFLIFSLLITDMSFRDTISSEQKEKFLCDLIIILKDMNEGESFNQEYLNTFINRIKGNGNGYFGTNHSAFSNINVKVKPLKIEAACEKFSFGYIINNKYKLYYAKYISNGTFALFMNKKTEEITCVICLNKALLDIQLHGNMLLFKDKIGSIQMNNVIMFKNKNKMIDIRQYSHIKILIDSKEKIKEIIEYYVLKRD